MLTQSIRLYSIPSNRLQLLCLQDWWFQPSWTNICHWDISLDRPGKFTPWKKMRNQNYVLGLQPFNKEKTLMLNLGDVSYNIHKTSKSVKQFPCLPVSGLRSYLSNISNNYISCPLPAPQKKNTILMSNPHRFFLVSELPIWLPVDIDCELSILHQSITKKIHKDHKGHKAIINIIGGYFFKCFRDCLGSAKAFHQKLSQTWSVLT